jgi:hypothetical protein
MSFVYLPQLLYTNSLHLIGLFAKHNSDKLHLMQLTKLKVRLFSLYSKLGSFSPTPKTADNCPAKEMLYVIAGG